MPELSAKAVDLIMKTNNLDEDTAIGMFLRSRVYNSLQDMDSELWNMDYKRIARLFNEERAGRLALKEV